MKITILNKKSIPAGCNYNQFFLPTLCLPLVETYHRKDISRILTDNKLNKVYVTIGTISIGFEFVHEFVQTMCQDAVLFKMQINSELKFENEQVRQKFISLLPDENLYSLPHVFYANKFCISSKEFFVDFFCTENSLRKQKSYTFNWDWLPTQIREKPLPTGQSTSQDQGLAMASTNTAVHQQIHNGSGMFTAKLASSEAPININVKATTGTISAPLTIVRDNLHIPLTKHVGSGIFQTMLAASKQFCVLNSNSPRVIIGMTNGIQIEFETEEDFQKVMLKYNFTFLLSIKDKIKFDSEATIKKFMECFTLDFPPYLIEIGRLTEDGMRKYFFPRKTFLDENFEKINDTCYVVEGSDMSILINGDRLEIVSFGSTLLENIPLEKNAWTEAIKSSKFSSKVKLLLTLKENNSPNYFDRHPSIFTKGAVVGKATSYKVNNHLFVLVFPDGHIDLCSKYWERLFTATSRINSHQTFLNVLDEFTATFTSINI